jgi:hypothetical protein
MRITLDIKIKLNKILMEEIEKLLKLKKNIKSKKKEQLRE